MGSSSKFEIGETNITHQVRDQLRRKILNSEFAVWEKINIDRLSSEWNVSKTPLREALRGLENERLVRYFPRKGYVVLGLGDDEIWEILELRMVLETYALQKGFDRIDREKLGKRLEDLEQHYELVKDGNPEPYLRADFEFHLEIIRSSENKRMLEMYENLRGLSDLVRRAQGKNVGDTMPQHRLLLEAILHGDREKATNCIKVILESVQKEFMGRRSSKEKIEAGKCGRQES
jgi:DNA-binding GntR family transcriptional regulator